MFREHENDSVKKDLSQPLQIHYFKNSDLASFMPIVMQKEG